MEIKGTQSEKNVLAAFAGESQARNRYTYYAIAARSEGKEEIALLFDEMADNEKEHAKVWFKILNDGLGESTANLVRASEKEHEEWTSMYPKFANVARDEGFEMLAIMFENIAEIEKSHENMFVEMLDQVSKNKKCEQSDKNRKAYICKCCGNLSDEPSAICPICECENSYRLFKGSRSYIDLK